MKSKVSLLHNVIGIGASAGGLEAIQELIACLPKKLDYSAVIIAQHLSPDYKSMLVELIQRKTKIPVKHIVNGAPIEANHIYIAPPSDDLTIKDKAFYLTKPTLVGAHPSVDILLISLAREFGSKAIGIVLSGTGKDGSIGISSIAKAGGISVAQEPQSAKYDGMPKAAISTGEVKYVLTPQRIGERLPDLIREANSDKTTKAVVNDDKEPQEAFVQILQLLEYRLGVDFRDYKTSTLIRRLNKRIKDRHFDNNDQYLDYIKQYPEELDQLFATLLIGVTSFFRDPAIFEFINSLIVDIVSSKNNNDVMRVWIPGCATGEEAYSFAILICEALAKAKKQLSLQIFATDIDTKALQTARIGTYSAMAVNKVPANILKKYFKKINDDAYEVNKDVRKLVLFSKHDVSANPPFLRLDLISCRNLFIYFNLELQKKVFPLLYYALNPRGYLILGKSENIGKYQNLFIVVGESSYKIFRRKETESKLIKLPQLKATISQQVVNRPTRLPEISINGNDLSISEMIKETLASSYENPIIVIDDNLDIVEIKGNASSFLQFKQGHASLNLAKLIIPQLQIELRAVAAKTISSMQLTKGKLRKLTINDTARYVRLTARPLLYLQPNNPYFMIVFEILDLDDNTLYLSPKLDTDPQDGMRVVELEQELDATREHMNSLIEELETSNEELQALNEEMQASNEELQASNEELETSNEELQATNEELENAYSEIKSANTQIEKQKSDLIESTQNINTVLNSTLTGFVLINKDYWVMSANKTAKNIFKDLFNVNLREGISYIKLLPDELFASFHVKFKKALAGKQVIIEEAYDSYGDGKKYFDVNYTPVAKARHEKEARYIAISLVDITERKKAELELIKINKALDDEKQFMHILAESIPSLVWTTDNKGKYLYCNSSFEAYLGRPAKMSQAINWRKLIHPDDLSITEASWRASLKNGDKFNVEHRIKDKDNNFKWHITIADAIKSNDNQIVMWVGSSTEIESIKLRQIMENNVSKLENQKNELIRINKIKDEFIGIASHQLRTPATAVKQYINLLLNGFAGELSEEQHKYLQIANDSNERQLTVIDDLLKTAQLDASDYVLHKDRFNLGDLVLLVVKELQPMLDFRNQSVDLNVPEPVLAQFDYEDLKLVITNLIENASKYSYSDSVIKIDVVQNDNDIVLSFQDMGVGIAKVDQERIFNKFTRVDNELSDTVSGTGLGLYWVKRIVELHNGDITVQSKPQKGSTFKIRLPV